MNDFVGFVTFEWFPLIDVMYLYFVCLGHSLQQHTLNPPNNKDNKIIECRQ